MRFFGRCGGRALTGLPSLLRELVTRPNSLASALLLVALSGHCQVEPVDQLPPWAQNRWKTLAESKKLTLATRLNPFVWRLDLDGDAKEDIAVLVRAPSGKEGIALLLRNRTSHVLGAGTPFGNGGDDFFWLYVWTVAERGSLQHRYEGKPFRLPTDGLVVIRPNPPAG